MLHCPVAICSDSLSLRELLLLEMRERVPDHSWLSRTRARLPHEVHTAVFDWVLALIADGGSVPSVKARRAHRGGCLDHGPCQRPALRNIVRRDSGEGYRLRDAGAPRAQDERYRDTHG